MIIGGGGGGQPGGLTAEAGSAQPRISSPTPGDGRPAVADEALPLSYALNSVQLNSVQLNVCFLT